MDDKSTIAQTLEDIASDIAERHHNNIVTWWHLLAAIHKWNPGRFNTSFPNLAGELRETLWRHQGDHVVTKVYPDREVVTILSTIDSVSSAWQAAQTLASKFRRFIDESIDDEDDLESFLGLGHDDGDTPSGRQAAKPARNSPHPTFTLAPELIERIANLTRLSIDEVWVRVLADCYAVANTVLEGREPNLAKLIAQAAQRPEQLIEPQQDLSDFVTEVAFAPSTSGGRTASQLAQALVDVAQWAALLDASVDDADVNRIDLVRLDLRERLRNRVNPENPALIEIEQAFAQFVGMGSVKSELRRQVDHLVVENRRSKLGLRVEPHRMHLAFLGNPGTGKTQVARAYGSLLFRLGLMPTDKFIEVDRSGLIGKYLGYTETKTTEVIDSAMGGILFIDEAYGLHGGGGWGEDHPTDYGHRALEVLVKAMEDRRGKLIVIFAGYRDETMAMIDSNPGLRSRFGALIDFPDYTESELREICVRTAAKKSLVLDDAALTALMAVLVSARHSRGFGNARSVELMIEAAQRHMVSRLAPLGNLATEAELSCITLADIPDQSMLGAD